jgi:hypothetical protein
MGVTLGQGVSTFNTRNGDVTLTLEDVIEAGAAPIDSPHFIGLVTVPTPSPDDDSSAPANTSWVRGLLAAGGGGGPATAATVQAVPPTTGSTLISCVYNANPEDDKPPGMAWCRMFDNPVYAWIVDPAGSPIQPVILGTLPDWTPPDTGDVASPRWVVREAHMIYIPDIARGNAHWLFNYLAYNNGAARPLYGDFSDVDLASAWKTWAEINPDMALSESPVHNQ